MLSIHTVVEREGLGRDDRLQSGIKVRKVREDEGHLKEQNIQYCRRGKKAE